MHSRLLFHGETESSVEKWAGVPKLMNSSVCTVYSYFSPLRASIALFDCHIFFFTDWNIFAISEWIDMKFDACILIWLGDVLVVTSALVALAKYYRMDFHEIWLEHFPSELIVNCQYVISWLYISKPGIVPSVHHTSCLLKPAATHVLVGQLNKAHRYKWSYKSLHSHSYCCPGLTYWQIMNTIHFLKYSVSNVANVLLVDTKKF